MRLLPILSSLVLMLVPELSIGFSLDKGRCATLTAPPSSQNIQKIIVAFGGSSADYYFAGLAEVATHQGVPIANENNRVIFAVQAMKIDTHIGTRYLAIGSLDLEFNGEAGRFLLEPVNGQLLEEFPDAPRTRIDSSLSKIFPRDTCLSDAQFDWTKW